MLQIKQIVRYEVPRYPSSGRYVHPPRTSSAIVRDAAALIAAAAFLESCMGPMPPSMRYVSESDARLVIEEVFAERGISLRPTHRIKVPRKDAKVMEIDIDGFNDSLQVGYAYVGYDNKGKWPERARVVLDSLNRHASPHVVVIDSEYKSIDSGAHLRHLVDEFLDALKAQGVI